MAEPRCYYFGCWNQAGHYMRGPGAFREHDRISHWGPDRVHLDSSLAPRRARPETRTAYKYGSLVWAGMGLTDEERRRIPYDSEECPQGHFLLHTLDSGFTAIQWWDRTQGDERGACNSTVLLEGRHTAAEMLAALAAHWPSVLANLTRAGVVLVDVTPRPACAGKEGA